jgi:predicted acyltransferase (DUF342 family)
MAGDALNTFKPDILYKKFLGVPDSYPNQDPSLEPGLAKTAVFPSLQIYSQDIPIPNPIDFDYPNTYTEDENFSPLNGHPIGSAATKFGQSASARYYSNDYNYIVFYQYIVLTDTNVNKNSFSYSKIAADNILKYAIPKNFDLTAENSYDVLAVWAKDGTVIAATDGTYPWVFDPDSGILTFYYNALPSSYSPPIISFARYEGTFGLGSGGGGGGTASGNVFTTDVSINGNLSVGKALSVNNSVNINGYFNQLINSNIQPTYGGQIFNDDTNIIARLFAYGDVIMGGNNSIYGISYLSGDVSMGSRVFINGDVSMNSRLFVSGDVSMNARLFVANDVSFIGDMYVGLNSIFQGDVSMNSRLFINGDVSMNSKLFINGDVSMSSRLYMGGNLSIGSGVNKLSLYPGFIYNGSSIVARNNSVTVDLDTTGTISFSDTAVFMGGNVGIGTITPQYNLDISGAAQISSGTSSTTYNNVYSKGLPSSLYASTVTPDSSLAIGFSWLNNGITWVASASSYYGTGQMPYTAFANPYIGNTNASSWITSTTSSTGGYSMTYPGAYTGNVFSTSVSINSATPTNVYGEWLQIRSSVPCIFNNYTITTQGGGQFEYRLPSNYTIAGSNDGNTWYAIHDASLTATAVTTPTATTCQTTSTFTVQTSIGSTVKQNNNNNILNYSIATTPYTYFRFIIKNVCATGSLYGLTAASTSGSSTFIGFFWNPVFNVSTQTGPSRSILYVDPSNINQIDVSGSLALMNNNSSTMFVSPNTSASAGNAPWVNNGITWYSTASNPQAATIENGPAAFNNGFLTSGNPINTTANSPYLTAVQGYNSTTGTYVGSVSTTNIDGSTTITGEYVELQSSTPVIMKNFFLTSRYFTAAPFSFAYALPRVFKIVGSTNNGASWNSIMDCSFGTAPISTTTGAAMYSQSTPIYFLTTTTTQTTQPTQNTNMTVYGYSESASPYTYFRIIVRSIMATQLGFINSGGDGRTNFFWNPTFVPVTSAVSLSLDIGVPNQLNIGGALTTVGAVNVGGIITTTLGGTLASTSGNIGIGTTNPQGKLHIYEATGTGDAGAISGSLVIEHGNNAGVSSIIFPSKNNNNSDYGYIRFRDDVNSSTAEKCRLEIGTENDHGLTVSQDAVILQRNGGFVGIGTQNPVCPLSVVGTSAYSLSAVANCGVEVLALESGAGKWRISMDNGANANLYFLGLINTNNNFVTLAQVALIENDAYVAATAKMNFTGQHRCAYDETINSTSCEGLIVNSTGEYWSLLNEYDNTSQIDHITINESLPKITLTKTSYCKSVFGVISFTEDTNKTRKFDGAGRFISIWENPLGEAQRVFVNSVGEGGIWVCNVNGLFSNGDYITSSTVPGYGMVQDNGQMMNYTVGKITSDCDFNPKEMPVFKIITNSDGTTQTITAVDSSGNIITKPAYKIRYLKPDGTIISKDKYNEMISNSESAYIAAFIGCTYHCG